MITKTKIDRRSFILVRAPFLTEQPILNHLNCWPDSHTCQ